jgi:hypothetical protein
MVDITIVALGGAALALWVFLVERKNAELEEVNDALCSTLLSVARGTHEVRITETNNIVVSRKGE